MEQAERNGRIRPQKPPAPDSATESPSVRLKAALGPLFAGTGGIDSWILEETNVGIVERLLRGAEEPLGRSQLNQLLGMGKEIGVSEDFFKYYWLSPPAHPYDTTSVGKYGPEWTEGGRGEIVSLAHLRGGLGG